MRRYSLKSPSSSQTDTGLLQRNTARAAPRPYAPRITHDFSGVPVRAKLKVGAAGDAFEREADRVADEVMRTSEPTVQRDCSCGASCPDCSSEDEPPLLRRKSISGAEVAAPAGVDDLLRGAASPLDATTRAFMEPRFGRDFAGVRVHTGAAAAQSAESLAARAYTVGRDIVFGTDQYRPHTDAGRRLLAHELTHVTQQNAAPGDYIASHSLRSWQRSTSPETQLLTHPIAQRAIKPEDVSGEMIGQEFELAAPFVAGSFTLAKGTHVTVTGWNNRDKDVSVSVPFGFFSIPMPVAVPKLLLRPVRAAGTRLNPYNADVEGQAKSVEKNEAALVGKTGAEKTRLEGLLATRRDVLNQKLIQETMFNRFDPLIDREVAAANTARGFTGAAALDPNLVKAMFFEESEVGTSGKHLEVPPTHPVKSRFNLGQVIDSSAMALLTMLESEQPLLIVTFFLFRLRSDLAAAQTERVTLKKKTKLTAPEASRLADLELFHKRSWEGFIWGYKAPGVVVGFRDAIDAFFAASTPTKNLDYAFWIHMAVLWLFEKKTPGRTWLEAIRAYNGSGARARHYRDAVSKRAREAAEAATAGKPFTPTR